MMVNSFILTTVLFCSIYWIVFDLIEIEVPKEVQEILEDEEEEDEGIDKEDIWNDLGLSGFLKNPPNHQEDSQT